MAWRRRDLAFSSLPFASALYGTLDRALRCCSLRFPFQKVVRFQRFTIIGDQLLERTHSMTSANERQSKMCFAHSFFCRLVRLLMLAFRRLAARAHARTRPEG